MLNLHNLEGKLVDIPWQPWAYILSDLFQINKAKKQLEEGKQETAAKGVERSWFQTREERKKEKREL